MIRIDADHITFTDDGRAWWVVDEVDLVGEPCVMLEAGRGQLIKPLDRPCDTCNGTGRDGTATQRWITELGHIPFCPDCDGAGRHTFEILVAEYGCGEDHAHRVSVVAGMILPVIAPGSPAGLADFVYVNFDPSWSAAVFTDHCVSEVIVLPSAAVPGMWAVKLKVAL